MAGELSALLGLTPNISASIGPEAGMRCAIIGFIKTSESKIIHRILLAILKKII